MHCLYAKMDALIIISSNPLMNAISIPFKATYGQLGKYGL